MSKTKKIDPCLKKALDSEEAFFSEGLTLEADPNAQDEFTRRQLLSYLSKAGSATVFLPHMLASKSASAAQISGKYKFCLYIHTGSQCGYSNGLLMPNDVGSYPKGVFFNGQQTDATNPILNSHTKYGSLVLNPYTLSLAGVSTDLTNCVVNSRSVSHFSARWYQMTGHSRTSFYGPSWQVGLAGALAGYNNMQAIPVGVGNNGLYGRRSTVETKSVSLDTSNSLADYYLNNTDHSSVPKNSSSMLARLWEFAGDFYKKDLGIANKDRSLREKLGQYVESSVAGAAQVKPGSTIDLGVKGSISSSAVDSQIDSLPLGEKEKREIKLLKSDSFINQLQLAAAMVHSRLGAGMSIGLSEDDYHSTNVSTVARTDDSGASYTLELGNGSETRTARRGAAQWAAIRLFWDYIKSIGMHDDVIVICSHEFSRTAANAKTHKQSVFLPASQGGEVEQLVDVYGKDHRSVAGYQILTGAFEGQKRFGTVADNFVAGATSGSSGVLDAASPSFNSRDIIGSILYKFDPSLFPRGERDVRLYYGPDFSLSDLIVNS